jgi:hypothetical protein
MASKKDYTWMVWLILIAIVFGTMVGVACRQLKINEDGVEQSALAIVYLQNRIEEMSDTEKEAFCVEMMRKEVFHECNNDTLNQVSTDFAESLDEFTRLLYFETIPESVLGYWPQWFKAVVPSNEIDLLNKRIIFHKVYANSTQKHFGGDLSYWTAVIQGDKISIEHFVSDTEAIMFAQVQAPKNMEFQGIMYGGLCILKDEKEISHVLIGEGKTEELDNWQRENSTLPIYWAVD